MSNDVHAKRETVSVPEAAEILGISTATAWKRVWDASIPSVRLGGRVLISRVALDRLLDPDSPAVR